MRHQEPVIAALTEQLECYQRLAKLAELQHEHVQNEQTEALLEVLGQRQGVLEQVTRLERLIAPAKQRWQAYLEALGGEERQLAEALLLNTRQVLERIMASDRNDTMVLQQRKLNLGRQIGQAAAGQQVNRSYAASAYGQQGSRMNIQR